jgi:hypothetical protein
MMFSKISARSGAPNTRDTIPMHQEFIVDKIRALTEARCNHPERFDDFTNELLKLQCTRQTYDVLLDELSFYSAHQLITRFPATEIPGYDCSRPFDVAETFDLEHLKKSIQDFDQGRIKHSAKFHEHIAKAGVVYVSVHLIPRKIYYLGQNGQHYLEQY